MPPKSKRQAGFFGLIASGKVKKKGFSRKQAREALKGSKTKNLPKSSKKSKRK
jgi:hypothetical protein